MHIGIFLGQEIPKFVEILHFHSFNCVQPIQLGTYE